MSENIVEILNTDVIVEIDNTSYDLFVENIIVFDYNYSQNMPAINNVTLVGNKTSDELGLASLQELNLKENSLNKVNVVDENSTNAQYPSAKCVYDELSDRADVELSNVSLISSSSVVQTALDGKVSKTGDTMTGALLLDGANFQKKDTFPTSTPNANTYINGYEIFGNDTKVGAMAIGYLTSGNVITRMFTQREVSGATKYSVIDAGITSSGLAYCSFPNTTCVDGQWVQVAQTIPESAVSVNGSTALTYTLNLPNDGHDYEVMICGNIFTGTTSGNAVTCQVTSDLQDNWINIARAQTRSASSVTSSGQAIVPVSSSHKIYLSRSTSYNGTVQLYMRAYRRLGTNS